MAMHRDVFISYSFGDGEYVAELAKDLEKIGLNAWYAQLQIRSGHWRTKIEDAIDAVAVVVVVVSAKTGQSREVENEFRRAEGIGKLVLPVYIEKCNPPLYLAALHSAMMYEDKARALASIKEMVDLSAGARRAAELAYLASNTKRFRERAECFTPLTYEHVRDGITTPLDVEAVLNRVIASLDSKASGAAAQISLLDEVFCVEARSERVRFALIGEPGAGKSTTLAKLFSELSDRAQGCPDEPIPILLRLNNFSTAQPFRDFVRSTCQKVIGELAPYFDELLANGRIALLMDGLNELPDDSASDAQFRDIISYIALHPNLFIAITCLSVDYTPERNLGIETYQIAPLNPLQVRDLVAKHASNSEEAEQTFWSLLGDSKVPELLAAFKQMGGTEAQFWTHVGDSPVPSFFAWSSWIGVRDNPFSLLTLARNPYLLTIIVKVRRSELVPSANRFELFSAFFTVLCRVAKGSLSAAEWIDQEAQRDMFTTLSRAMLDEGKPYLTAEEAKRVLPPAQATDFLRLAEREKLLEIGDEITFPHQLLRAYFGSFYVEKSWVNAGEVPGFPNPRGWWLASSWEESILFLAGKHARDPVRLLTWLRDLQPELVSRCLSESGCVGSEPLLQSLTAAWVPRLQRSQDPPEGRAAVGRALGRIGRDARPGVMLCDGEGLPVIEWVEISESTCCVGNVLHERRTLAFQMSKYLITNAQFTPFIDDGGYTEKYRHCWSKVGWEWCQLANRKTPDNYTEVFRISNHPRIGTVWYEAHAYSRWLTERLRAAGSLEQDYEIRLPTEADWEAAARGPDGVRKYPWGNYFDYDRCNVKSIRSTTAVGIFPEGASPEGVFDLVGNAWSWCLTKWDHDPMVQNNSPEGDEPRVYRGGSWAFDFNVSRWKPEELQCDQRYWIIPLDDRPDAIGFYLVKGRCLNA